MEINAVDVVFRGNSKKYTFNSYEFNLKRGEKVVVETVQGLELAEVKSQSSKREFENIEDIKPVLRRATEKDIQNYKENLKKEKEYIKEIEKLVEKYNLEMKIVSVELTLNQSKLLINFTSETRVDFRELVKEIAGEYKIKIELRQIGARDETKIVGGLGPCGNSCCCKQFLNDFEHVSIKMAKTQNLSLNPTKINGLCGRLMCCLAYENEHYAETSKLMPKIGSEVITPEGKAFVVYNNLLKRIVQVKLFQKDGAPVEMREFDLSEIKFQKPVFNQNMQNMQNMQNIQNNQNHNACCKKEKNCGNCKHHNN